MSEEFMGKLQKYVSINPGLSAAKIAKGLSVTRKEVNSLLYKHNKTIFSRIDNGDAAPTWGIFNPNVIINKLPAQIEQLENLPNPGKLISRKILEKIDLHLEEGFNFKGKTGLIKFEVLLVGEGQNAPFTRYEVLDKNDLILIINEDSFLFGSGDIFSLKDVSFHIFHSIADCLTQYRMQLTQTVEEDFLPTKQEIFKMLITMDLMKSLVN